MKNGYYITSTGKRVELEPTGEITLVEYNILELVIPDGVTTVTCSYNQITKLVIPDSVTHINCRYNQITNLIIPNSVKTLFCDINVLDIIKYKDTNIDITLHI